MGLWEKLYSDFWRSAVLRHAYPLDNEILELGGTLLHEIDDLAPPTPTPLQLDISVAPSHTQMGSDIVSDAGE